MLWFTLTVSAIRIGRNCHLVFRIGPGGLPSDQNRSELSLIVLFRIGPSALPSDQNRLDQAFVVENRTRSFTRRPESSETEHLLFRIKLGTLSSRMKLIGRSNSDRELNPLIHL